MSNAKRAIDCRVEQLLTSLGLSTQGSFPRKLETLSALGIVAPRIVRKVNHLRNLLEHEFKDPAMEKVDDAIDVAELFILATDRLLDDFAKEYRLDEMPEGASPRGCHLTINFHAASLNFLIYVFREDQQREDIMVKSGTEDYFLLLRLAIMASNRRNWDESLEASPDFRTLLDGAKPPSP